MVLDPLLDCGAATGTLLATGADLVARVAQFEDYPTRLVCMSRRWFPEECYAHIGNFLTAPATALDVAAAL